MTEARTFAFAKSDGLNPKRRYHPNHADMPQDLINATGRLGEKRARFTENRVKNLIADQSNIVEKVILNEPYSNEDSLGHDLTVTLQGDSPIRIVYVQVKSSRCQIIDYKQEIRDKFFKGRKDSPELVKRWLTEHGIILINGSETKTDEDILRDSFKPQLERIKKDVIRRQNTDSSKQMRLFTENSLIQIFPSAL